MANSTINLLLKTIGVGPGREYFLPVDGGAHIYEGTLVSQLSATAAAVPGSTALSGPAIGVAVHESDNSSGSDGTTRLRVKADQVFEFANAAGGDACSEATPLFSVVYMYDDHTIADNSNSGARQKAGRFCGMSDDGKVRVFVGMSNLGDALAAATDVSIADAGTFTATSDVEAALQEIYQHLLTANASVCFSLRQAREVTSGGDVGNAAAIGGVLASDTTPILRADANESEEIAWAASNSDIISFDTSLPSDFDGTGNVTVDLLVASGATDAASFSLLSSWDKGAQVTDSFDDSATKSATLHTITATVAAADIPNAAGCVTFQLVPPAHTTDAIILGSVRLNYKRKLLTA
jgi:hypothetical protein